MTTQIERILDLSGGIQNGSTWQLRKPNEVEDAINGRFGEVIGAIVRRYGYQRTGNVMQADKTGLGLTEGKWIAGSQILGAVNNSGDTETKIKSYDTGTGNWTDLTTPDAIDPNTEIQFADSLNETYAAGMSTTSGNRMNVLNIVNDSGIVVSKTKNLLYCPQARFITEYGGSLYAINCKVGSNVYADRAYKSSPALGAVTFVQGNQTDVDAPVDLVDNVPTMTSNSTPIGVVTASSEFNPVTHGGYVAFNDVIEAAGGGWTTNPPTTAASLQYDFGSGNAKTITYYSLVGSNAGDTVANRAPKTWIFEGSNNGSSWTTLDTQTNVPAWAGDEKRIYSISNTTAYRYYRLNVSANQGATDVLQVKEMELLTSSQGTKDLQLKLDSVRYVKVGMTFDIYKAGTNTKLFTITVASVDKPKNTITFTPYNLQFATTDVNTTTDVITLSSTTNFPTGTTVKFTSTGGVPGGLTANTIYYVINTSPTTIKLATNLANAKLGVAIDLTSQGTGTHTARLSYVLNDNDELWLTGRYSKLTYFWNTDYPTEQKADYLRIPPSVDADSSITGFAKGNNRLFLFTKNSTHKWDGANLPNVYEDIGCISHKSIQNIGDWLIWLDAEGKIRARNDATGQEEMISRPIRNLLKDIPEANLLASAAGRIDNTYKLSLGSVGGSFLRVIYDFDTNTWSHDIHARPMVSHMRSTISGKKKLYFLSNTGRMYADDTGNLDDTDTIPFIVKLGRRMSGSEQDKNYHGSFVYTENMTGGSIKASVNGEDFKIIGQIKNRIEKVPFSGIRSQLAGRDLNIQISSNSDGEPPLVSAFMPYFNQIEDKF